MGVSAYDSKGYLGDVASNAGWSAYAKWAREQRGTELALLGLDGWSDSPEDLVKVMDDRRPDDDALSTIHAAIRTAAQKAQGAVLVTDGVGVESAGAPPEAKGMELDAEELRVLSSLQTVLPPMVLALEKVADDASAESERASAIAVGLARMSTALDAYEITETADGENLSLDETRALVKVLDGKILPDDLALAAREAYNALEKLHETPDLLKCQPTLPTDPPPVPSVPSLVPSVLRFSLDGLAPLPPLGKSGLPESLEQDVPVCYRYWTAKTVEQAEETRAALVDAMLFTEETLKTVDGVLRRVVTKTYLPTDIGADEPLRAPQTKDDHIAMLAPGDIMTVPHAELAAGLELAPATATLHVVLDKVEDIAATIAFLTRRGAHWLVEIPKSESAIAALSKLGVPFCLRSTQNKGAVFVASFEPMGAVIPLKPTMGLVGEPLPVQKMYAAEKAGEERFALGIVLEPETVDSQRDITASRRFARLRTRSWRSFSSSASCTA
jgi:hypothetical protein